MNFVLKKPYSQLLKKTSVAFAINVAGMVISYFSHVLFGRWLGVDEYGSYAYALSWLFFLVVISGLGLSNSVLRFVPQYRQAESLASLRGFVSKSFLLVFCSSVVVATFATLIIHFLDLADVNRNTLLIGIWTLPFLALFYHCVETIRAYRYIGTAYLPHLVLQPILHLSIISTIYFYRGGIQSETAIFSFLVTIVFFTLFHFFNLYKISFKSLSSIKPENQLRLWLSVSFPFLLMAGFIMILKRADVLLIGILVGAKEAGIYNAASKTASLISFVMLAVNAIAAPMISEYYKKQDKGALQDIVNLSIKLSFFPSIILGLLLFGFSQPVLGIFGHEFLIGVGPLKLLICAHIIITSVGPANYLVSLTGHHNKSLVAYGCSAGLNIVLNLTLIPKFGNIGAAMATLASMVICHIWLSILAKKYIGIRSFIFTIPRVSAIKDAL